MKLTLLSSIIVIMSSCAKINKKELIKQEVTSPKIEITNRNQIEEDTLTLKEKILDTTNTKNTPVKVISAKLLKNEYSDHKDIQLVYKNVSQEDIKGIKFEWYCENSFDKPASGRSFYVKGKYTGQTAFLLKKQKKSATIWEDFSTDANTIVTVRAYEVVFTNGTKWTLKQSVASTE
jgi:hypothetical protein